MLKLATSEYRGRVSRTPHPHDLPQEDCRVAFSSVERPDLLAELIRVSRDTFGFYTRHFPFAVKHSWVAGKLEPLPAGSRALDFGAGLSPLPLFLANRGVRVECIDNSTLIRELPPKADWNEWGFFDYGRVHPNLAAHNCDVLKFEPGSPVDVIYSTGALAHLLARGAGTPLALATSDNSRNPNPSLPHHETPPKGGVLWL